MSLIVNGTEVKQVIYNGVDLSKIIYNGVTVFEKSSIPNYFRFVNQVGGTIGLVAYNRTKCWDGTLEYSSDGSTWETWSGTSSIQSTGIYLYLRGTGNTKLTNSTNIKHFNLGNGSSAYNIAIEGNLEILLDYTTVENGGHPTMASNAFRSMFYTDNTIENLSKLIFPSTLVSGCFNAMFRQCTRLRIPPKELPATTILAMAYQNMFYGCTSLIDIPVFSDGATYSGNYALQNMYRGCSSLKISATQTGTYTKAIVIPSGSTGTQPLQNMFTGTGGTFTGTPTAGTTYYVSVT